MSLQWKLGFRNHKTGKYLTVENFGFKLNVNSSTLKKKQIFTLVSTSDGSVHIQNHLGRFISGDRDGKIHGDNEGTSDETKWEIEPQADGTWALKTAHGFYFHGEGENLKAFVKDLPADGKWAVHLAIHPQVNLYNVMRKRYCHLNDAKDGVDTDEDIPWGDDALLTIHFFSELREGRYGIIASNNKFLNCNGKLTDEAGPEAQFMLGFHDSNISLRDHEGNYLSPIGRDGRVKSQKDRITKDELFLLADSQPQFNMVDARGKYVSNRSSSEVKADQADVTDLELFQLEVQENGTVFLKNSKSQYWAILQDGTVSTEKDPSPFTIEWLGNRVKLVASNGKYVYTKPSGALIAGGDGSEETAPFTFTIINRPQLILRGQYGFLGIKGNSGRVEVNKSKPEKWALTSKNGDYFFEGPDGYWTVNGDGVSATGSSPTVFHLEFVKPTEFLIKHADSGKYLQGEQSGGYKATGTSATINTLWEF